MILVKKTNLSNNPNCVWLKKKNKIENKKIKKNWNKIENYEHFFNYKAKRKATEIFYTVCKRLNSINVAQCCLFLYFGCIQFL